MTRDFTSVGVIGLGTMGAGIVEVFARNGIDVIAVEVDEAGIEHGKQVLAGSTGRALARGKNDNSKTALIAHRRSNGMALKPAPEFR